MRTAIGASGDECTPNTGATASSPLLLSVAAPPLPPVVWRAAAEAEAEAEVEAGGGKRLPKAGVVVVAAEEVDGEGEG
jgi:hypothetical protein